VTKSIKEKERQLKIKTLSSLEQNIPSELIKIRMSYNRFYSLDNKIPKPNYAERLLRKQTNHKLVRDFFGIDFNDQISKLMVDIANSMKVYEFKINVSTSLNYEFNSITFGLTLINRKNHVIGFIYINGGRNSKTYHYKEKYNKIHIRHYIQKFKLELVDIFHVDVGQFTPRKASVSAKILNANTQKTLENICKRSSKIINKILKDEKIGLNFMFSTDAKWQAYSRESFHMGEYNLISDFNEIVFLKAIINDNLIKTSIPIEYFNMNNIDEILEMMALENY